MSNNIKGWVIGLGAIGQEYVKILNHLKTDFFAIGRGEESALKFNNLSKHPVLIGGIKNFINSSPSKPDFAIVAVTVDQISNVTNDLLDFGVSKILIEKPGGMNIDEIRFLKEKAEICKANVYVAYNRRYLSSSIAAKKQINYDGGVRSFHFDFTEWPSRILSYDHPKGALENWFFLNSTHVVDLAFFLGGWPKEIFSNQSGALDWHKPAIFSGSGISEKDAVFSYKADWGSAGRWSVEIMTPKRKLIFAPLEKLKEQRLNDINIFDVEIDDYWDQQFKPGFFLQTQAFLEENTDNLLSIEKQYEHWHFYNKIMGRSL